jgi:hypothetical protein
MSIINEVKKKMTANLDKIEKVETYRKRDKMFDVVFHIADVLMKKDLDLITEGQLLQMGGKLAGISAYLGNIYASARAERDITENAIDEAINRISIDLYSLSDEKITLAKSKARLETKDLQDQLTIKEYNKNAVELLLNSTNSMLSFIQSGIKVKQGERFMGKSVQDQH